MEDFFDLNVVLLLGMTDVDDKIIRRASQSDVDWSELARKYEHRFFSDMKALNVNSPSMTFRVTDSILEIISFVRHLLENGFAYVADDGSVYFDVTQYGWHRYGRLHRVDDRTMTSTRAAATADGRVHGKRNVADFALWKAVVDVDGAKLEPGWQSPWCAKGRPGWHIECSTMVSRAFGDHLDVHSGGVDLQFPHHENELAQSCARHSIDRWANYWLHSGHVLVDGEKMSKSLGNAITVRQFLDGHEPDELRVACLMSHYRKSMDYKESVFDEPRTILRRLRSFVGHAVAYIDGRLARSDLDEPLIMQRLDECKTETRLAFSNDFDTHLALERLMGFVAFANRQLSALDNDHSKVPAEDQTEHVLQSDAVATVTRSPAAMALVVQYVRKFTSSLGIALDELHEQSHTELTQWQSAMDEVVRFREEIRKIALAANGNDGAMGNLKRQLLEASDRTRKALLENGFEIKDHRKDSIWIRTKLKKS